jgi:hypothetical protein
MTVVLHHSIRVDTEAGLALRFSLWTRPNMHTSRVPPEKERFVRLVSTINEVEAATVTSSSMVSIRFILEEQGVKG